MRIRDILMFASCFGLLGTSEIQNEIGVQSGTILTYTVLEDKLIVAVDSRFAFDPPQPIPDNSGCKVIFLSRDTFFFYSGGFATATDLRNNKPLYSANSVARAAFKEAGNGPNSLDRLIRLAQTWGGLMKPISDNLLKLVPNGSHPNDVQLGGFGGFDARGNPTLILANMGVTVFPDGHATTDFKVYQWPTNPKLRSGLGGTDSTAGISEFFMGQSDRSKLANAEFQKRVSRKPAEDLDVYRHVAALEAAIQWNPNDFRIGLPIDALVLERGKSIRWIQRKQNCYTEDYKPDADH